MGDSVFARITRAIFRSEIERQVKLKIPAVDDATDISVSSNTAFPRDRYGYDRDEILRDALEAWRVNPLARRVIELTSQYIVGGGITVECQHERTHQFIQNWWNHRLNRMDTRVFEWCDELSRAGDLFVIINTDVAGMSYVRALPASSVKEIETAANDVEQEIAVIEKPSLLAPGDVIASVAKQSPLDGRSWKVYDQAGDAVLEDGSFQPVILHYAVNRPVGAKWGESDIAPMLRWLSRYAAWLEDRARLNRFRQAFLYLVQGKFASAAERQQKQAQLSANPPQPGSILVTDDTEQWKVLQPTLDSFQANEDGLALKKMVAVGSGNPMHFLAEPESSTRTTAESAGGPTFRHYQ